MVVMSLAERVGSESQTSTEMQCSNWLIGKGKSTVVPKSSINTAIQKNVSGDSVDWSSLNEHLEGIANNCSYAAVPVHLQESLLNAIQLTNTDCVQCMLKAIQWNVFQPSLMGALLLCVQSNTELLQTVCKQAMHIPEHALVNLLRQSFSCGSERRKDEWCIFGCNVREGHLRAALRLLTDTERIELCDTLCLLLIGSEHNHMKQLLVWCSCVLDVIGERDHSTQLPALITKIQTLQEAVDNLLQVCASYERVQQKWNMPLSTVEKNEQDDYVIQMLII